MMRRLVAGALLYLLLLICVYQVFGNHQLVNALHPLLYNSVPSIEQASFKWAPLTEVELSNFCRASWDSFLYCNELPNYGEIDPGTLRIVDWLAATSSTNLFAKDRSHVYFLEFTKIDVIAGADSASFTPILNYGPYAYAKDDRRVYWGSTPIAGADPKTFRVLYLKNGTLTLFSIDKSHVYDPWTQELLGNMDYQIARADPSSFALIENRDGSFSGYTKDKNYVFDRSDEVVGGADPRTFLPSSYSTDTY